MSVQLRDMESHVTYCLFAAREVFAEPVWSFFAVLARDVITQVDLLVVFETFQGLSKREIGVGEASGTSINITARCPRHTDVPLALLQVHSRTRAVQVVASAFA